MSNALRECRVAYRPLATSSKTVDLAPKRTQSRPMIEWQPISEADLFGRIERGYAQMPIAHQRLWNAIRIEPRKWHQHPYGDDGGGFWSLASLDGPLSGSTISRMDSIGRCTQNPA